MSVFPKLLVKLPVTNETADEILCLETETSEPQHSLFFPPIFHYSC